MIEDEFDIGNMAAVNFGVRLRSTGDIYSIPVNWPVQNALKGIAASTVGAFERIDGAWAPHDISEDYGAARKVYAVRNHELMAVLSGLYEAGAPPDLANLEQHLSDLEYYFAVIWDSQDRKIVGIKKATQLKATLGAQNRLMRLVDGTFVLIEERVLRLDQEFDALITDDHVFMLNIRPIEQVGDFAGRVAEAAQGRVQTIHDTVPFLDLSRIKEKIERHPKMARLACSIAERPDLANLNRDKVEQHARAHGVRFKTVGDRLLCNVADEAKLLEVLDSRRYHSDLTEDAPVPYRASGRQKVSQ